MVTTRSKSLSEMPATPAANSAVAKVDQKVTTRSKSLSASNPVKIPSDSYAWRNYGRRQVKSPEGSRRYFICKYSACNARKVELWDQFNSVIEVVYKGQHKHDPPKKVILTRGKVLSTVKSLKRKSMSTHVVRVPSSLTRSPANADVAQADQKVTTRSKSLPASKPVKIPTDSYAWITYGLRQVKNPEGSRRYFKCKYNACNAKKVELCDQFSSVIDVVYKGQHKHDPPKKVISKGSKVLSTVKPLKRKSMSTHGVRVPSSLTRSPAKPATLTANADVTQADRKVTTYSKSLSASKPVKIPSDSYAWRNCGQWLVKGSEGFRKYFKCKYSACNARKVELCDHFNSVIEVIYKGQHKHDPPKKVILKGGNVLSATKSLKRKSISTHGLKDHLIEVVHTDDSATVIAQTSQNVTTDSKSLSASNPVKIPSDGYAWVKYFQRQVKSPEGSRRYFKCKYRACRAKKVEFCDQFDSVIEVVYKGQHKHVPPKKVILTRGKVLSTVKLLKRKSMSTHGVKDHPIEVVHIDDSATVIAQTSLNKSPGLMVPSSFTRSITMPATPTANADVAEVDQNVTTGSKSLCASNPVKIPSDSYAWRNYGQRQVKGCEGSQKYFKCKYSACNARKVELCDQFNSVIKVIYKGQHKHDPPNKVISKGGKVLSAAKSLKRKSISTHGLKDHPIEVVHTDDSATVIAQTSQNVTTGSKSLSASNSVNIPSDGYAWLKYGQIQVKSPEGSRSYFKCNYSACQAKKVESRDQFNSIIKVVYKGQHKHDPPKIVISKGDKVLSTAKSLKRKSIPTHGLKEHPIDVVHIDGSETKQRLKRNSSEISVLNHPKKPKFIVHAAANTKVSADGYKWRKYRQKMVKGNPHPRNCYKCAFAGCTIKKHMEKVDGSSQMIITYKGLHNHDVPGASPQSKKRA